MENTLEQINKQPVNILCKVEKLIIPNFCVSRMNHAKPVSFPPTRSKGFMIGGETADILQFQ